MSLHYRSESTMNQIRVIPAKGVAYWHYLTRMYRHKKLHVFTIILLAIGILYMLTREANVVYITEQICDKAMHKGTTSSEMEDMIHVHQSLIVSKNLSDKVACHQFNYKLRMNVHTTQDELQFPLAFSIAVYKDYEQVARLLRAIYRNHNLYCLHVDRKASSIFREQMSALAACLGTNVIVPLESDSIDVRWADFSTVEAFLSCIRHVLLPNRIKWRYVMTVSGTEFPLRTNWELVRIMRALNGSNMVDNGPMEILRIPSGKAPFKFNWHKGSLYVALRREMTEFILNDDKAQAILSLLLDERRIVKYQDEIFLPTLLHNPTQIKAPGACLRSELSIDGNTSTQYLGRYVEWRRGSHCLSGYELRAICMMGVRHLPILANLPHLFVNKFIYDFQPFAYDCLERWLFEKVSRERVYGHLDPTFNESLYAQHYCVRNHLP